jgi:hypothetical protein
MVQNIIVFLIILLAIGNAIYHLVKSFTRKYATNCGSCPNCGIKQQPDINHLKISK